jgi:pilus assembly protein CpaF
MEGEIITLQDIFLFDFKAGIDENGRFRGQLQPTGLRPYYLEKLSDRGIQLPQDFFVPNRREWVA